MNTSTVRALPRHYDLPLPAFSAGPAPLLKALAQVEFGSLMLIAPDGERRLFSGTQPGPAAHWHIHDWDVLKELVARGEIGLADAYIEGRWESQDLEALLLFGLMNTRALEKFFHGRPLYALWLRLRGLLNLNSKTGSRRNVVAHYDLGNDFYRLWLDEGMTYSGALFAGHPTRSLEEAQRAKYRRILEKLNPSPGDRLLEIGCGWGGFAEEAAQEGLLVTAVTLSDAQAAYARERIRRAGLSHLVKVELKDYRDVEGRFDHIVSIGMFEHVGKRYWRQYFDTVHARLAPQGKAIVQSIALDDALFESLGSSTGVIEHYIFPGGMLPSKRRFIDGAHRAGLDCKELFCFGHDYAITLKHWLTRFESQLEKVRELGYDERFIRLWRFYLTSCIASFKSRRTDVMQAELTRA